MWQHEPWACMVAVPSPLGVQCSKDANSAWLLDDCLLLQMNEALR